MTRSVPLEAMTIFSSEAEVLSTQVLRPGVEATRCRWRLVWGGAPPMGPAVLEDLLGAVPDATLLQGATVETSAVHVPPAVYECVALRGIAARRIREVVLPSVGGGHDHH